MQWLAKSTTKQLQRKLPQRHDAGVDEAGRGCLAGPVIAAACVLPEGIDFPGLADSKVLTPAQREKIFALLTTTKGVRFGIGFCDVDVIDRINILRATFVAMQQAIAALPGPIDRVLVDGPYAPEFGYPAEAIIDGDSFVPVISAASNLAKVTRDRLMVELDKKFPQYNFKQHKGYGTAQHLAALKQWGPCAIHRMTFAPVKLCS